MSELVAPASKRAGPNRVRKCLRVWLVRDEPNNAFVSLKFMRADFRNDLLELRVLRYLSERKSLSANKHPGAKFVIRFKDNFKIDSANGRHQCLVTEVAGPRSQLPVP
jgi:serine/threonine-protein kinase SRPK3